MKWTKKGLIFAPDSNFDWMSTHASVPIVDRVADGVLRVYFGTRDKQNRSFPACMDVEADDPHHILHLHDKPVLSLGKLGTFDDNGVMPSWIVDHDHRKYLYYMGWNPQVTVSVRVSIGLAISVDGGESYRRYSEGPILDRDIDEPYYNTGPCVMVDGDTWKLWYSSVTRWEIIDGRPEAFYHIKYADSSDGIHWRRTGKVCIDYDDFTDAIARPCVFKENGTYKMLYSYRNAKNFRTNRAQSYRLGYAESRDGVNWTRKDDEVGIDRSDSGWDSEMIEYCYVKDYGGRRYLFYCGNGFGKSGFGYAILQV